MMKRFLFAFLVAFPLLGAAPSQQKLPPAVAGETIEVSLVDFDVVVTDRQGHPVHGLTRNDFEVFEDGKRQDITHFAEYAAASPIREKRTLVFFIEKYPDVNFRVEPVYKELKKTIHDVVQPGDSVMIETWNGGANLALDATDDLTAVDSTLDEIAHENINSSLRLLLGVDSLYTRLNVFEPYPVYRNGRVELQTYAEVWYDIDLRATHIRDQAAAINSLINAMANEGGRKALVLMTRGIAPMQGSSYFYTVERSGVSRWHDYYRGGTVFDAIKATAAARNVPVYAFPPGAPLAGGDPLRGTTDPFYSSGPNPYVTAFLDQTAALRDLAKTTGGAYAISSDIPKALRRMRVDLTDYYSFAYRVEARKDNRVRNITVKTSNPEYRVRTRRQYIEKNDDIRIRDQVIASFFRQPPPSGIAVQAILGEPVKKAKHRSSMPVSVHVPASSFMTSADKGAFSVYIATSRDETSPSEITKHTVAFTGADLKQAPGGTLQYDFELVTNEDASLLSIGVYDEVSHDSGFARIDLPRER